MSETVKLCCCPRGGCEAHPRAMNQTTPTTFIREPLRFSRGYAVTGRIHLIRDGRALCGATGRKGEEWTTSDEMVETLVRTVDQKYGACKRCADRWAGR